jgi:hypothetical protein
VKQFENRSPFKKCYNFTSEKQKFCFSIDKMLSNQNPWLSFVLKAFDFNLGAKFFSKRTWFSKKKGVCN